MEKCTRAPEMTTEEVSRLFKENYGQTVAKVSPLAGYEDRNYKLELADSNERLVLKIVNPTEARVPNFVDAVISLMKHVGGKGLPVATILPRLDKKLWDFATIQQEKLPIFAIAFLEGTLLHNVSKTAELLQQLGELLGKFHLAVQDFHHNVYEDYRSIWSLDQLEAVAKFVPCLPTEEKRTLVSSVVKEFLADVLPLAHQLPQGQIHSDFNESNILCVRDDQGTYWYFRLKLYYIIPTLSPPLTNLLNHFREIFHIRSS